MAHESDVQLFVDTERADKIRINLDVYFPQMPCSYITLDAMDSAGELQLEVRSSDVLGFVSTFFLPSCAVEPQPVQEETARRRAGGRCARKRGAALRSGASQSLFSVSCCQRRFCCLRLSLVRELLR